MLLLADEQESMVSRYLERGVMYVLDDNGVKAECVVTDEGDGVLEIKTSPSFRNVTGSDTGGPCSILWRERIRGDIPYCRSARATAL